MSSASSKISKNIFDAHVAEIFFNEDVCFVRITLEKELKFKPGQYIWLVLPTQSENERQAYSIADYSDDGKEILIIFKRGVSKYKQILQNISPATKVKVIGPFGSSLVFEKDESRNLNFYAGGVGIAPFLTLIKYHSQNNSSTKINLNYFTSDKSKKIIDMLQKFKNENKNFTFRIISRGSVMDVFRNNDLHCIVGSQEFVDYIYLKLTKKGIEAKNLIFEQYYPSSEWTKSNYSFHDIKLDEIEVKPETIIEKYVPYMVVGGLVVTIISGLTIYFSNNFSFINLIIAVLLFLLLIYWLYTKNSKFVLRASMVFAMVGILYPLYFSKSDILTLYWFPFVPILNYIILGRKSFLANLVYLIIIYLRLLLSVIGLIPLSYDSALFSNSVVALTLIYGLIYVYTYFDKKRLEKIDNLIIRLNIFKSAIESSSNHIVITDENGLILFGNKASQKITGFTYSEMLGNTPRLWGGEMDADYYKKLWLKKKNGENFDEEIINRRKDGTLYSALAHISPIIVNNKIKGYIGTEEDISKLKELDKMKDEFVSVASHELRTPMTAIKGFVSMILDGDYGKLDKKVVEPLNSVQVSIDRLIYLVNDLLNVSRIESGRLKINLEEVDPLKLAKETLNSLSPIADSKKIKLAVKGNINDLVQVDSEKLRQIITNLVGNSLKFTDKGSIKVITKKDSNFVKISIVDTGIGIPANDQKRIFGKFEQVTDNTKGRPQGTGLGLYICKILVEKMGGKMWLEKSESNKGSTFSFTLPVAGSKEAKECKVKIDLEAQSAIGQKDMATIDK